MRKKDYFQIYNDEISKLNRNKTEHFGLPEEDILMADNKVKYDATDKIWIYIVCNQTNNKYNKNKSSTV